MFLFKIRENEKKHIFGDVTGNTHISFWPYIRIIKHSLTSKCLEYIFILPGLHFHLGAVSFICPYDFSAWAGGGGACWSGLYRCVNKDQRTKGLVNAHLISGPTVSTKTSFAQLTLS